MEHKQEKGEKSALIHKEVGETPLEALERFRLSYPELKGVPLTYAGRLDPMAEGVLLILIGEECKHKEKYLDLNKRYKIEVVFGIETDSYDSLGMPNLKGQIDLSSLNIDYEKFIGKFEQPYPPYSSKTVNGVPLYKLARANQLPEKMPAKHVEIFSIKEIGRNMISGKELLREVLRKIKQVKGDFRQREIIEIWKEKIGEGSMRFPVLSLDVTCSSGTYMRLLAKEIGKDQGVGCFALSINRVDLLLPDLRQLNISSSV